MDPSRQANPSANLAIATCYRGTMRKGDMRKRERLLENDPFFHLQSASLSVWQRVLMLYWDGMGARGTELTPNERARMQETTIDTRKSQ